MSNSKISIGIIGAGDGAVALLKIFEEDDEIELIALAYRTKDRPAVKKAEELGMTLYADYKKLAESSDIDLIIEATGAPDVIDYLEHKRSSKAELLCGEGVRFLWLMVGQYKKRQEEMDRSLQEQKILYSAGVMLASAANTEQTLDLIMESALSLTGMAAGSIALYDEERGLMHIKVSMGFDHVRLPEYYNWKVRLGGLTGHILSNDQPTVIEDLLGGVSFDTSHLLEMGVRSLIATPLKVEGKIIGILYVDDFKPKMFTEREVNILNLLGVQAAAAIDKALLLEKAETLAVTDELTKLYNHRYFVRALEREMKRADRYGYTLGLCMIDVDYFKNYNDTFGHLQGNIVLTSLSKILLKAARDSDIVARYGGEEFAVILVQADEEKSAFVAERIRKEVEAHKFSGEETQPNGTVSISIGVANYPNDAKRLFDLIESADRAMYRSKNDGRNRVTMYNSIAIPEEEETA